MWPQRLLSTLESGSLVFVPRHVGYIEPAWPCFFPFASVPITMRILSLAVPTLIAASTLVVALPAQLQELGGRPSKTNPNALNVPTTMSAAAEASYNTYGSGCAGSGLTPLACNTLNGAGGTLALQVLTNEYCYGMTITQPTVVLGFRLFTQQAGGGTGSGTGTSTTPALTMTCGLYLQGSSTASTTGATPDLNPVATGTMEVGANPAFYEVYLDKPVIVAAGQNIWISQYDTQRMAKADLTAGTAPAIPTYWRRPPGGGTAWAVTGIIKFPSWQLICHGGAPGASPRLTFNGRPALGGTFDLMLRHGSAGAPTFLFIGLSKTSWSGLPLPFDMGLFGTGAGCSINASGEVTIGGPAVMPGALGDTTLSLSIPNVPALNGATVYNQWISVDPWGGPSLPLVFSNGGQADFGL